ncbi:MAG TPA: histidine kinase dimerization/phospho-acceptor domain-containing protein [Qipengyuania sp.]|nr:histidine kinase dimerization/phospho-acceptor domain-containing protein [Qipengyuania sp.]
MHVDDRLATVLHHRAAGERAARVQFRQLLDLLGEPDAGADPGLARAAFRRLDALGPMIPLPQRERIAAECSARIRNPALLAWFGGTEAQLALAALSRAALTEDQWTAVIPELPIRARGLLRHRRNLPVGAQTLLDRLGVRDRVLPEPELAVVAEVADDPAPDAAAPLPALDLGISPEETYVLDPSQTLASASIDDAEITTPLTDTANLGALVRRIEAFQRARAQRTEMPGPDAPRLPLDGEAVEERARPRLESFLFTTDDEGRIDWAEPPAAPLVTGTRLAAADAASAESFAAAFAKMRPVSGVAIALSGAEAIAGEWVVEGAPRFARRSGAFTGYVGRFRRPSPANADARAVRAADRVRQLLHELRTPVTAIQGFAEVIQQQTVGPVPHEYRALAAAIAGDAARMLAGFAELERLARLEAGTQELPEGTSDFVTIARRQVAQLQTVLSPRVSRLEAEWRLHEARVALAPEAAEMLAWRFLGTLAAATAAGERVSVELAAAGDSLRLAATLPAALAQVEDVFAGDIRTPGGVLGTGLFGAGFALRLARAEARAAGGDLLREDQDTMVLTLPLGEAGAAPKDAPTRTAARVQL